VTVGVTTRGGTEDNAIGLLLDTLGTTVKGIT
jgi:hypothetical protein